MWWTLYLVVVHVFALIGLASIPAGVWKERENENDPHPPPHRHPY